ncbi:FGGY-family carbohydrate kinase [Olivibacter ginsenosidimutans]|uniref:FGGY-family carbohydrate kinase n=1 Tax=Olivibacter ginsenosidimutans TaxID=1176537 RepID=A0ABP9BV96_9SPHI
MNTYVIGIDVGTQGVRVALIQANGTVAASASRTFPLTAKSREEQSPLIWWDHTLLALQEIRKKTKNTIKATEIKAIATTSTSGTVIPIDRSNEPLHHALMYSDKRSVEEGTYCRMLAKQYQPKGFTAFSASCGLPKILWFTKHFPEKSAAVHRWIHAADFITGRLSGQYHITDYTNALKTGYDVSHHQWPTYVTEQLVPVHWLQKVVPSGTVIGTLQPTLAQQLDLPNLAVVVGLTDGCASQMASGAICPGDWNTTIGTTMVIKGVTKTPIIDPTDSIYSHRHPEGFWMPGGASNTGADWVSTDFNASDLAALNQQAERLIPSPYLAWPLKQQGERFPFVSPQARGFAPEKLSKEALYTANMEGVAYIERYAYEIIEKLAGEPVNAVFTAGGGSNSDAWLRIRSSVLNKPIYKCRESSGVLGAAICAASKTIFNSVTEAVEQMTHREKEIYPEATLIDTYEENYRQFIQLLINKQYLAI